MITKAISLAAIGLLIGLTSYIAGADGQKADQTCAWDGQKCIMVNQEAVSIAERIVPPGLHCQEDEVIATWQNDDMSFTNQCVNYEEL